MTLSDLLLLAPPVVLAQPEPAPVVVVSDAPLTPPVDITAAQYPGAGTYPAASVLQTLNALVERKAEDEQPDLALLFENALT